MAKYLKRKRDPDAATEDEVHIPSACLASLTIVQVHNSEDLMSVDRLDPESSSPETEISSVDDGEGEKWGGTGGNERVGSFPSSGRHVKVPAGHELREMKEASELYKSSAFKLQVRMSCSPSAETPY